MFETFSKLPVPVCSLSENFLIKSYNSHWEALLGPQDFLNKSLFDFFTELEDKDLILKQFSRCSNNDESLLIDFELSNHQKQFLPISWAIVHDKENKQYILCAQSSSDKQAIETRFARMYNATTDAIMLLDGNSFTDCNKATLEVFAVSTVKKFIEYHPGDLSPEYQPDGERSFIKANRMIEKAFAEGRNLFEWTHRKVSGEDFLAEVLLSPIILNGKTYLQASVRDISERVRLQKELDEARMYQMNASKMAALGEVAGGIAHEINNPMTVIRIQTESILKSLDRNPNLDFTVLKNGLNRVIATSDRIGRIIKGLKLLSRDSTMDPLLPVDLQMIIQDTLAICEEKLRMKNISLEVSISGPIIISCRSVEISQVLINLISNSIDAIENTESPWLKIMVTNDDDTVTMKVMDSGPGIPALIAEKIMQPFYTTKDVGKGSGLGLSITKRIIENHMGNFVLDQKSPNTTFIITIPIDKESMK